MATWSAGGQHDILDMGNHAPRTRPVAGKRAVHDREQPAMDLLLDHEQVHQRLVNDRMGPVPVLVQQAAEGVLHRAGGGGEDMGLDGGQVDDVFADEPLRES